MKKLYFLLATALMVFATGCENEEIIQTQTTTSLTVTYNFPAFNEGVDMTKAGTNASIFNDFYQAIKDGRLIAPTYDLTFTEVTTGESFQLQGEWNQRKAIEVKMGTYNVTGTATAEGEYIQAKCSVVINDTDVAIDHDDATISLDATYDCALVIFADESIESVVNHTAGTDENLFGFENYIYAFVNDTIGDNATDSYLLGTRKNGSQFTILTVYQPFEKGKFYVYDTTMTNTFESLFDVPEMEEGKVYTQPLNMIYYTSSDGQIVEPTATDVFGANIVSNTYENGRGVITFDGVVTAIGDRAFCESPTLKSIVIPEAVTLVGSIAFYGCPELVSITFPDSVERIGGYVALYCPKLAELKGACCTEDNRCLLVDGALNSFASAGLTEYVVPEGISVIDSEVFCGCSHLTSITLPAGLTKIENDCFRNCSGLAELIIPESVTEIGYAAFYNCSSLAEVYCKPTTPPSLGDDVFYDNASGRKIYVPAESVEAYKSAERWRDYADDIIAYDFEKGEVVVHIQETWKIYYTATAKVTPYKTDVFGANIVSNEWDETTGNGVIIFDGDVASIGYYAFYRCSSLESITIPEGVTSIGYEAFSGCTSLAEFNGKFASEDGRCLIVDGVLNSFAPYGLTEYTIPDGVTSIGDGAFCYCTSLANITITTAVTSIGIGAFSSCESLASVTIPDSVTEIGDFAFCWCSSLAEVYCKATTPPMGGYNMFDNNALGRKIYVPAESLGAYKTVTYWTNYADDIVGYDFEKGEVVPIPKPANNEIWYIATEKVTPHATNVFGANIVSNEWNSLTLEGVITFDGEVTSIGDEAFMGCESLASITIPEGVTSIGYGAFWLCSSLTSITIPEGVASIGNGAFYYCESLASVTIPDSVTEIGYAAFEVCWSLAEVYCKPTTPPMGGNNMFTNNDSERKIYVPSGSVEAYKTATYWSEYADAIEGYDFE